MSVEIICRRAEGIEPPFCCMPPLEERTARLQAAKARAEAMQPTTCPNCRAGKDALVPAFPPDDSDTWTCEGCGQPFDGGGN